MATTNPSYGMPNWDMIKAWFAMPPEEDGPFWALNLMQYKAVATYDDADEAAVGRSGKEADDAYAPLSPLQAIGAMVAFHGDVTDQRGGSPAWDRVGIVRYPSRSAFFAMQQRDDFKDQHQHKEAGMAFTIVMACHPTSYAADDGGAGGSLVLTVSRGGTGPDRALAGVTTLATFSVEGVIVGDERTFDHVRFEMVDDAEAVARVAERAAAAEEAHVVVVERDIDDLVASITTASTATTPTD